MRVDDLGSHGASPASSTRASPPPQPRAPELAVWAPTLTARARIGGRRQAGSCNGGRRRWSNGAAGSARVRSAEQRCGSGV
eukprot:3948771-Prymnesium_polylepis.1